MSWIEADAAPQLPPPSVRAALLRKAMEKTGPHPGRQAELALALFDCGDSEGAARMYEAAARADPRHWVALASVHYVAGRYDAALAACDRAAPGAAALFLRGKALRRLGRDGEASAALRAALEAGAGADALTALLMLLARKGRCARAACAVRRPAAALADTAPVRAYRAIALSRLGRTAEANALVDLERHVARERFVPPESFGGVEAFNRALAERSSPIRPVRAVRDGVDVHYEPRVRDSLAFAALYAFIRDAMQRYIDAMPRRGLDKVMPPPPQAATLFTANVVLRQDGRNGQHIHGLGYISAVYHVRVPDVVAQASDTRGRWRSAAATSRPAATRRAWGTRFIKPEAGWLTLFPSHIFHDVVPSGTAAPRISVAADLQAGAAVNLVSRPDPGAALSMPSGTSLVGTAGTP
ncbi:MAG: putative 2OG-Fe(II) oxygenase [Rhizomicrobium sp.]